MLTFWGTFYRISGFVVIILFMIFKDKIKDIDFSILLMVNFAYFYIMGELVDLREEIRKK
jgi:hypothetical protein